MKYGLVLGTPPHAVVGDITTTDPKILHERTFAARFEVIPDDVEDGWLKNADGTFSQPALLLSAVQDTQVQALRAACTSTITGGFSSSALGSAHTYPSASTDQANMVANATAGGDLWCAAGGTWAMVTHTAAQAKAVLTDFVAARDADRANLATLTAEVQAATTAAAVQAVVWA